MCLGERRDSSGCCQAKCRHGIASLSRHDIDMHGVTHMCLIILYSLKKISHLLADGKSELL